MLIVGDLIENSYSHLRYKVLEVLALANHWVEVRLEQVDRSENYEKRRRQLSLWMRNSDEAPNAFRKIEGTGTGTGTEAAGPKQATEDKDKEKCRHCGRVGTQYFFKDKSDGITSVRCFICGADHYQ